jgi:hypothetical protein
VLILYLQALLHQCAHRLFNILLAKKFLSLQPVVMTQQYYKEIRLIKRQKSFQGFAMYGHEVTAFHQWSMHVFMQPGTI